MKAKPKFSRVMWIVVFVPTLLFSLIAFPILHEEWLVRNWEAQIKQNQDPEELRAWALKLCQPYITNRDDVFVKVANRPPSGVPVSAYGPEIMIDGHNEANEMVFHVMVIWKVTRAWGLFIGNTNYAGSGYEQWKPGIWFYREP